MLDSRAGNPKRSVPIGEWMHSQRTRIDLNVWLESGYHAPDELNIVRVYEVAQFGSSEPSRSLIAVKRRCELRRVVIQFEICEQPVELPLASAERLKYQPQVSVMDHAAWRFEERVHERIGRVRDPVGDCDGNQRSPIDNHQRITNQRSQIINGTVRLPQAGCHLRALTSTLLAAASRSSSRDWRPCAGCTSARRRYRPRRRRRCRPGRR